MKKRVLESQVTDNWNGYPLITLKIDEIWQSVPSVETHRGTPFKSILREDILENGMKYPIMVVATTYNDLIALKKKYNRRICDLPENTSGSNDTRFWSVWGGSQRLTFAREEGYTHIHCTIIPRVQESIGLQKQMRKGFPELYHKSRGYRNR